MAAAILVFVLSSCGNTARKNSSESAETNLSTHITKTENNMTTTKKTIQLTRAEFLTKVADLEKSPDKWVYLGDKPCIIDFYADWCGPCKMISPILEELAGEYDGEIYIYKVDTEAEQQLAAEFGIRSIPSLLFVPMDEAPQMAQGALPKDAFKQAIEEVLLKKS
ncbi:thioredoxin [Proteiniphilum sp. X52]|uniref:thioredoxin n=1 Tax=Proteiniphilum sp. X52 TaxID=2382159 RepID=UPI001C883F53|nr:thioredoxin [Proteiniphilum sp. X52]